METKVFAHIHCILPIRLILLIFFGESLLFRLIGRTTPLMKNLVLSMQLSMHLSGCCWKDLLRVDYSFLHLDTRQLLLLL